MFCAVSLALATPADGLGFGDGEIVTQTTSVEELADGVATEEVRAVSSTDAWEVEDEVEATDEGMEEEEVYEVAEAPFVELGAGTFEELEDRTGMEVSAGSEVTLLLVALPERLPADSEELVCREEVEALDELIDVDALDAESCATT